MQGKRILICCNRSLNIGGIEKALTTFIKAFDTKSNDVTLVLLDDKGVLTPQLDTENIHIFYTRSIYGQNPIKEDIKAFNLPEIVRGLWNRFRLHTNKGWYEDIMYTHKIYRRKLQFEGHFDAAISFTTDYSDLAMVLDADTDKRIAFVHADASQNPKIARYNDPLLRKINKIYCVSESSRELFLKVHPKCKDQMDIFHNIILPDEIIKQSKEPDTSMIHDGSTILCTVGRLSPEKGQDMIPEIAKMLKDAGYRFCWYLIGDGALSSVIEEKSREYDVEDCVKLLGRKENPYPYMAGCDIYVQTSLTEALCTTTLEAKILLKPVLTTNVPGMQEQFVNGMNGYIVKEMTAEALYDGIKMLLDHPTKIKKVIDALEKESIPPKNELAKVYSFIEA